MYYIEQIEYQNQYISDQRSYTIKYRNDEGTQLCLKLLVGMYDLSTAYSAEEHMVELVMGYDPKLGPALRDWYDKWQNEQQWKQLGTLSEDSLAKLKDSSTKSYASDHKQHVHAAPVMYDESVSFPSSTVSFAGGEDAGVASLPGLAERVKHPKADSVCDVAESEGTIRHLVMHLNDYHMWTREQIADWLETLDVDLRFKSPDDRLREQKVEQLKKLKNSVENLKISTVEWNAKIKEANMQIKMLNDKMNQLQEEENVED